MDTAKMPETVFESSRNGYTDILACTLKTLPRLANTPFKGLLPLIGASTNGRAEAVKVLLEHGAVVDARDKKEEFALMAASLNDHTEVIEILLAHGARLDLTSQTKGKSALNAASEKGKLESVKVLLAHGADVESEDINGWSALFVAAKNQHVEVVKHLLQHGANPDVKDMTGMCPLIKASTVGHAEVVRALLEGGAQVDIQDDQGNSALNTASLMGFSKMVDLLLEHGAQVNLATDHHRTPLASASFSGHTDVARTLLNHGAKDPSLLALLVAILMDKQETVQLFCESGTQVHPYASKIARTLDRITLLELCAKAVGDFTDLHSRLSSNVDAKSLEQQNSVEELMEMEKLILETINGAYFKSITSSSRRAGLLELAPAKGEKSLTLQVVLREFFLLYLAADWQTIGALLDLPAVQLRAIKNDNHLARNCMREMLEAWLNTADPPPTWEKLVEAVEILDESNAQYLHDKYCLS